MTKALISVSNKEGLVPFAEGLARLGIELLSTGGTKRLLEEAGVPVKSVSEVTGFPEILDGRVKTLHPKIHGGLLGRRELPEHREQMREHAIDPIDFVIVNLYPFKETVSKPDVTHEEAVENIDIGGPSMIRSAAKNYESVTVVCDPSDYEAVLTAVEKDGGTSASQRARLAAKAFRHTAAYDALIAEYLTKEIGEAFPEQFTVTYEKKQGLRYGENPHQQAAFYASPFEKQGTISSAKQLHGKELSYNNIRDTDAALQMVKEFYQPAVVAVKHMNPCGIGTGETIEQAYLKAYEADPVSIFGGIVAANREIDAATAAHLSQIFLEIIVAPGYTEEAFEILSKKKNIRLLTVAIEDAVTLDQQLTSVGGGLLVQDVDSLGLADAELTYPTDRKPSDEEMRALEVAWKAVKHVKSNAIVLAKGDRTIGVGAGQMNRVGAAKIAIEQAGEEAKGSVMGSDAFFPMPDTVEEAAKAGVTAIIQPGGSIKDQESIDKANEFGIAMVLTGIRHFKH
ncbi:bifunctional phosphoribosylaminoimidazolecarboxamide formyltransferase/IMP cyclohydrolase [Pullulanibacillus sp. KACC 23026]|uniref:bifunctional phosphoribosylaminoimidazolecarboxamide formyltransferase/IMP cyclohydrolase n=1 Tax=Pullulanibacillus sp. KACC 23026 TaxID=3028315 RepID=UPI0023B078FB|nr:bifunctional phosphoribosylaminoimidazolecarboxamide formyltransferase/IMP cyclohydrolase [Pullulanibacillus sp. KACC 23026]WEG12391.1 bifunctional phosphoribosylaminoimidazolecarboxamide formyltransferase/IMP cyclohydrolase [Pullulanibacillus sp. KACC 23026]